MVAQLPCCSFCFTLSRSLLPQFKNKLGLRLPGDSAIRTPHFHCHDAGSIPDWGTKIPHASHCGPKKREFVLFPTVHPSLEPKSWPMILIKVLWTLFLALAFSIGIFRKAYFFTTALVCCSLEVEWTFHFQCTEMSSRRRIHTIVCIEMKENVLDFFRAALGYCRMSVGVQSLIGRLHVCMKAHLRHAQQSPEFSLLPGVWKDPGVKIKKWWGRS